MTLPPQKIGDKGQRYQVKYAENVDHPEDATLGYSDTKEGAERMAAAWRAHPSKPYVWIVDRQAPITNVAAYPPPKPISDKPLFARSLGGRGRV
jgi:hypothetical protein